MWHMPIKKEHRKNMKREICDLNNTGKKFSFILFNLFLGGKEELRMPQPF